MSVENCKVYAALSRRKNHVSELRDPEKWVQMWMEARYWLATSPDAPKTAYKVALKFKNLHTLTQRELGINAISYAISDYFMQFR